MGRGIQKNIIRVVASLIGVGAGGAICLGLGWAAGEFLHAKLSHPEKATAQAISSRFPEARNQPTASRQGPLLAGLMQAKDQQVALLTLARAEPPRGNEAGAIVANIAPQPGPEVQEARPKPAVAAARRSRPNALLDDGQIAGIKKRLNLTPSQERLWPAVETELRKLSFAPQPHQKDTKSRAKPLPTIELSSAELERLKTAATPLIMSFSADQKDELRTMARITGLEKFAP
jgi:hypothetical protein